MLFAASADRLRESFRPSVQLCEIIVAESECGGCMRYWRLSTQLISGTGYGSNLAPFLHNSDPSVQVPLYQLRMKN